MGRASLRDLFAIQRMLEKAGFHVIISKPDNKYRVRVFYRDAIGYREVAFSGGLGPVLDFLSGIWFGYEKAYSEYTSEERVKVS